VPSEEKVIELLPGKELSKKLLKGPPCESCLNRFVKSWNQYCAIFPKEPLYEQKCICPNWVQDDPSKHPFLTISGGTAAISSWSALKPIGFNPAGLGTSGCMTYSYNPWALSMILTVSTPPKIIPIVPATIVHEDWDAPKKINIWHSISEIAKKFGSKK
jgi:hypothetical protein